MTSYRRRFATALAACILLAFAWVLWTKNHEQRLQIIIDFPVMLVPDIGSDVYSDGVVIGEVTDVIAGNNGGVSQNPFKNELVNPKSYDSDLND